MISIDFGTVSSGAFTTAGVKPDGVNPATRNISIQCNGIDAQTNLTMRVQAEQVSGNAIVSDNADVGYVITDSSSSPLKPNDLVRDGAGRTGVNQRPDDHHHRRQQL